MDKSSEDKNQELQIKFPDELIGGAYANNMIIAHTKEEFVMDFIMAAPPAGTVTSRLIISPGHVKRILNAIADNIEKYEQTYGIIEEASEPKDEGEFYKH